MSPTVLIVDDDEAFAETVRLSLSKRGLQVAATTTADDAFRQVTGGDGIAVVLVDLVMPGLNGIDLCRRLVANRSDLQVIAVTGFGSLETAVEAFRAGAHDFVTKPVDLELLHLRVERALEQQALREELRLLRDGGGAEAGDGAFIGRSDVMRRLDDRIARAAGSDATVLVTGESGVGKELVAQALHRRSPRARGPFVAVNCSALPENLMESELFGHTRGAFTDARAAHPGILPQAHSGTVFLDEIGEAGPGVQAKLLRVLEEKRINRVGDPRERAVDVRIIAATNRPLGLAVAEGRFREDLFFRLNVIPIEVPPLRRRGADVLLLADHFVAEFARRSGKDVAGYTEGVAEKLMNYAWPGNVRELRNAVERAVALTRFERLIVEDLPEAVRAYRSSHLILAGDDSDDLQPLADVERRYILHVLQAVDDNKARAARILGVDRKTLYRKLELYERRDGDPPGGAADQGA